MTQAVHCPAPVLLCMPDCVGKLPHRSAAVLLLPRQHSYKCCGMMLQERYLRVSDRPENALSGSNITVEAYAVSCSCILCEYCSQSPCALL